MHCNIKLIKWLKNNHACKASINWVSTQKNQSIEALWHNCTRGDWLLWISNKAGTDKELLDQVAHKLLSRIVGYLELALCSVDFAETSTVISLNDYEETAKLAYIIRNHLGMLMTNEALLVTGHRLRKLNECITIAYYVEQCAIACYKQQYEIAAIMAAEAAGCGEFYPGVYLYSQLSLTAQDCKKLLPVPVISFESTDHG